MNMLQTGIERAVAIVGSQAILAKLLSSRFPDVPHPSQQAISNWVRQGHVPLARAQEISALTKVPVADLVGPKMREILLGR